MNAAVDRMAALYRHDEPAILRVPPHSAEAEQSVLGGLMLSDSALAKVSDWLAPEDFYRREHQLIYRAILEMAAKGKPYDAVTLGEWFEGQGESEMVSGGAYLVELASTIPSAANVVAYAEIVRDKSILRQGITHGTALVDACFNPAGRETTEILANTCHLLTGLRGDPRGGGLTPVGDGLTDWFNDLHARYESGSKVTGIPYPWAELNRVTHGLQPGELTIIAGRPSMGKSIMGLNLALFTALRGSNVALFSLEMTARQVNRRNIASLGNVPHDWLLAPDKEGDHWNKVTGAIRQLKSAPLLVDESAGLRIEQIVARARRAHMQKPIELLVLDHMHDVTIPGKREARFEVGDIAAAGKMLAKEFNCPAVWLAQLGRAADGIRPTMKHLRESGEIEQKSDVIWFLFREDYVMRNEPGYTPTRAVELILGKGRDLEVGAPLILREDFGHMAMRDWDDFDHGPVPVRQPKTNARGLA